MGIVGCEAMHLYGNAHEAGAREGKGWVLALFQRGVVCIVLTSTKWLKAAVMCKLKILTSVI